MNPGGLRNIQDIKVLICYILSNINIKIKKSDLISSLQNEGISNYFETSEAFSDLESTNNLICIDTEQKIYTVSDTGKVISDQLGDTIPRVIKDKSIKIINDFIRNFKNRRENTVKIRKQKKGYNVICEIAGDENFNLLSFDIYVPDIEQAIIVKKSFRDNPGKIYRNILAMLTNNDEFLK